MTAATRYSRALTLAGYAGFVLIGWNAVLLPSLIRSVEPDFRQSDAGFGLLYFVSAVLYVGGSFGGGFLTERVGRRGVLSAAAALLGLGLVAEAIAPSWAVLLLAALAVNCGAGAIDGGVNGLVLDVHAGAHGGALNRLHLCFSIGTLAAPAVLGQLLAGGAPWRPLVLAPGIGALALAAALTTQRMPSGRHTGGRGATASQAVGGAEQSLLPFLGLAIAICGYVAAEAAVASWLVKALSGVSIASATAVLSVFGGGLALGRLICSWFADRVEELAFTLGCFVVASVALVAALLVPSFPLAAVLFGVSGLCYGPIYPMIMAMGGTIYPRRLATLSGSLAGAAAIGAIVYPPLIGLVAAQIGLRAGLVGAGLIGIPAALALIGSHAAVKRVEVAPAGSGAAPLV